MIFRRDPLRDVAARLYAAAVDQARQTGFYAEGGVPDTLDGRFEMLSLHIFLLMRRLKDEGAAAAALSQRLADALFADLDANLREMGAGDLGVGPRVKRMAKSFYGRIAAYEAGMAGGPGVLEDAVRRNVYGTVAPAAEQVERMAAYARSAGDALAQQPLARLLEGRADLAAAAW
jgi:cytochrome b pre-mRNA-processing protein 3